MLSTNSPCCVTRFEISMNISLTSLERKVPAMTSLIEERKTQSLLRHPLSDQLTPERLIQLSFCIEFFRLVIDQFDGQAAKRMVCLERGKHLTCFL